MSFFRFLFPFAFLFCLACNSGEHALETLHGRWACDGAASVAGMPAASGMSPQDKNLTAGLYNDMRITIDTAERVLELNLGGRQGRQSFTSLHDDGGTIHLMVADELLSIDVQDKDCILVYDPRDEARKMVFRRL